MVASFQDVFESLCTAVNRWLGAVTTRTIPEPIPTTATTPPQDTSGSESMRISQAGIDLIKSFEGLKLEAYRDPVGVVTIGWGHTKTARMGQRISRERAEELLRADVSEFEKCVSVALSVPVSQPQFDALVSWAYNVGCGAMRGSTLMRKLNAGDVQGAAGQFLRWNKAGGRVLNGLTRRREAERKLFLEL